MTKDQENSGGGLNSATDADSQTTTNADPTVGSAASIGNGIEVAGGRARAPSRAWAGKTALGRAVTQHAQCVIPMQQDIARQWQTPLQHERCIGAGEAGSFDAAEAGALKHQGHEPDSIRMTVIPTTKILAMRRSTSDEPIYECRHWYRLTLL